MVWIPPATEATARVYQRLCEQVDITGNLVPDAQLAALAVEHGVELASADADFMRFPGLRWMGSIADSVEVVSTAPGVGQKESLQ